MAKIEFNPPGKTDPGFLRRQRKALGLKEALENNPTAQTVDDLVDYLVDFVTVPEDREEAREALLDATEAQFMDMLTLASGGDSTVPPGKGGESGAGSKPA